MQIKNLLPRKVFQGVALIGKLFNIQPRFPKRFYRLTNTTSRISLILLISLWLSGYYPVWSFPPIKKAAAQAEELTQKQEIIASSFAQPINLPHPGYLSTRFSAYHPGIDIASGLGMPVHPITAGVVEETVYDLWGYGHYAIIDHANGFKSLYGHMGRIFVKKGDEVTSQSTIGEVGLTGNTSGPHTHLEVTKDGKYIDPLTILPPLSDIPKPEYLSR